MAARVRCTQHGIFYDQDGPGCPFCQSQKTNAPKPSALRRYGKILVGAGVVLLLGAMGIRSVANLGQRAHEDAVERDRMDPNRLRAQIEELERILFAATPPGPTTEVALIRAMEDIGYMIDGSRPGLRSRLLEPTKAELARLSRTHAGIVDLTTVQEKWEEARTALFFDADWFRGSDNLYSAPVDPVATGRQAWEVKIMNDLHAEMAAVARTGRTQIMYIEESPADRYSPEGRRQARIVDDEWRSVGRSLRERMDAAFDRLPADYHPKKEAGQAFSEMRQGMMELQILLADSRPPSKNKRRQVFDKLDRRLTTARFKLDRFQAGGRR